MKEFLLFVSKANLKKGLYLAILLFLPTQIGYHFWPPFSFLQGQRVDYLSPTVYFTDALLLLLVVWHLFFVLCRKPTKHRSLPPKQAMLQGLRMYLFPIFLLGGALLSISPHVGVYGLVKLGEFYFFGVYTAFFFKQKKDLFFVPFVFAIGVVFESTLSLWQFFHQAAIGGVFYFFGERTFSGSTPGIANAQIHGSLLLRPYGTFSHPNVLAGYLLLAMLIISFGFFSKTLQRIKGVLIGSLFLGTLALLSTLSRVAIVSWLLVSIVGVFVFYRSFKRQVSPALSAFVLLFLVVMSSCFIFFTIPLFSRFSQPLLSDDAVVQRVALLQASGAMIQSHFLLGVGLGNFLPTLSLSRLYLSGAVPLQPVHNIFVLVMSETGLVGLVFFLWFLVKTFSHIQQKKELPRPETKIKTALFFTVLFLGLFDHYFLTLQQGQLLFTFILGLCWSKA